MRRLVALLGLGLIVWTSAVRAGEFELPTLRGTQSFAPEVRDWRGWYGGGQIAYHNVAVDATNTNQSLVAHMLRVLALENQQLVSQWPVLGKGETRSLSYGGFVGYNIGWESVILGFEASWYKIGATVDAPSTPLTRATSAGCCNYLVTSDANATMAINSYGTLRMRIGWEAPGNLLPFVAVGGAVAQASYSRSAIVSGTQTDSNGNVVPFRFDETDAKTGAWIYGVTMGAGVDFLVLPNVFLRAEYEYVAFLPVVGFKASINTARAGVGIKF